MLLDMLHSRIEALVTKSEWHKLGQKRAHELLSMIHEMAKKERAVGREESRVALKRRIDLFADAIKASNTQKAGGKNGGRVHTGGTRSTDT